MDAMTGMIIYLAIALGFSFLCSVLEAVLLSITPGFVAMRAKQGDKIGKQLKRFKQDIDRPLAAVLTLNTFAHTIGAAGVGAKAQDVFGKDSLAIVSAIVTVLILLGSEIIPKTIGAVYWRQLAAPTTKILVVLCWILGPFIWLSQLITKLLRPKDRQGSLLSRADIGVLAEQGYRDGALHQSEQAIIGNMIRLEGKTVTDIMIPRDGILFLSQDGALSELQEHSPYWHVSRIPLEHNGDFTSYIFKDDIFAALLRGLGKQPLSSFQRPLLRVTGNAALVDLYHQLAEASEHIAVVTNDQDEVIGLVTMEDLIESLLGFAITDESDLAREEAVAAESIQPS